MMILPQSKVQEQVPQHTQVAELDEHLSDSQRELVFDLLLGKKKEEPKKRTKSDPPIRQRPLLDA
jgi:hypothetical protein